MGRGSIFSNKCRKNIKDDFYVTENELEAHKKAIILLRVRKINKIRRIFSSFIVCSYHVRAFIKSFEAKRI